MFKYIQKGIQVHKTLNPKFYPNLQTKHHDLHRFFLSKCFQWPFNTRDFFVLKPTPTTSPAQVFWQLKIQKKKRMKLVINRAAYIKIKRREIVKSDNRINKTKV
ncbi:hypothetical protein RYX36_010541 [Vicia faba]